MTDAPEVIDAMVEAHLNAVQERAALGDAMRAALRAASAVGWRMVPVEATEGMLRVGHDKRFGLVALQWVAMLAAAPKLEEQG